MMKTWMRPEILRKAVLLCFVTYGSGAIADEMCTFTEQEREFFDFSESYPFPDKDFSPENVKKEQMQLEAYKAGTEVKYYIPKNTLNVIEGGRLQKQMLEAGKALNNYIPKEKKKWDRKQHELKYAYLKARKDYCDFRRSHYVIDW